MSTTRRFDRDAFPTLGSHAMARFARSAGVLALAIVLSSACGGPTATASPATSPGQAAEPSTAPATGSSGAPSASGATQVSFAPGTSDAPTTSALPSGPVASGVPTGAAECSGSHDNRVFFEAIAGQVPWAVYCAVLPDGWFVQAGSFSLRSGGRMEITYHGPNGALLTLVEGNVCEGQTSACPVAGEQLGPASFGDRQGTLTRVGSGYAIDVDASSVPGWSATGTGMDQATFTAIAAALFHVEA
jgi:hypothetical protein